MAALDFSRTTAGSFGPAGRISALYTYTIGKLVAWNDARMTRNALASLTDRELDDIGMCRGDIELVAEDFSIR
ncbi:protein of unknown function [Cribrihabitans marinus]|uniref:YjiS-like domain-containing protein n=1 Tax=Cribrihabitans marinus TaxID=1227549 RepID=A0A1H7AJC9_9RHOB|nr:DUF1127 domain-containing protein [Cribrihabitans marinus]GGH31844.1 hypothetical protein GCM10010973_22940 [Cribrihabitans marinus]SEJ65438.1 protein of unknown function [Cribrihabitans marinus]